MPVANKILKVIESVGSVQKDGKNQHQGYNYTSAEAFLAAIRVPMVEHGLVCIPAHVGTDIVDGLYICRYEFTLIDIDDPEQVMTLPWMHSIPIMAKSSKGDYLDDKALGKSQTYAHRYFLMKLFLITDKDSDIDAHDSSSQYSANDRHGQQQPDPTPKELLWNALKNDTAIKNRYTHEEHLRNAIKMYEGDVVQAGFGVVKAWLLNRESSKAS